MSNWTHVAGIIRINDIRVLSGGVSEEQFREIFGKELNFDDSEEEWDNAEKNPHEYMPFGSEGSLHMLIWTNPVKESLNSYVISIFGDLRDHDDSQSVIDWFKNKCDDLWIRNATITVENEMNGTVNWTYDWKEDEYDDD